MYKIISRIDFGEYAALDLESSIVENHYFDFYKEHKNDKVWQVNEYYKDENGEFEGQRGPLWFSFDKETIFNLWQDYPWKLTKEQKEIFDKENPYWADFFAWRQNMRKT